MIDLAPVHLATVRRLLKEHAPECEVRAFGSRVAWTAKDHSDLDLVLVSREKLAPSRLRRLREAFEESNLPMRVDALDWHTISEAFQKVVLKRYEVIQQPGPETPVSRSGMLRGAWRKITLADAMGVKHGYAFPGESIRDKPPGDILVTPGNFAIGGGFKGDKFKYFAGPVPEEFVLHEGDLIVTMTDLSKQADTLGYPALVPRPMAARFLHNQRIGKVLIKPGADIDKRFLFYLLRSAEYRDEILASATGTTVKHTSPGRILAHKASIPPLAEQKAIAGVLGALDDKIELNRRMNATLEAMARALFQSWFVDFDPVRAKLDGRQPVGLDKTAAALFPASFQESEVGHIPKGWIIRTVGEVVDCVGGGTPSTAEPKYWEGGTHHWTTPKDFSSLQTPILLNTDRKLTDAGIAKISSGLLPVGTLLLSSRAPVGYLAIAAMPVAINQGFIALKCNERASKYFMLNWCQTNMAEIESRATGTTFAEISKQNFRPIPVALPPKELMAGFTAKVAPFYAQITANLHQSLTLATLRDTLLPKLLSGKLSYKTP